MHKFQKQLFLRMWFLGLVSGTLWFLLVACTFIPEPTPTPKPEPTPTPTLEPSPTPMPELEILSPSPEAEFTLDDIINIGGTHNFSAEDHVWIFLRDIFGGYYVQNPSVELLADGTWEATNIRPRTDIRNIIAIRVDDQGHQTIERWVDAKRWGQITQDEVKALPGYLELARVKIVTPSSE